MIAIGYAAPFGVFRDFTAGYFRASFRFAPPSVLYGLLLNLCGMEMRAALGPDATLTRDDLPVFQIASAARGADRRRHSFGRAEFDESPLPGSGMLFQQLHSLPVGATNKHRIPLTKGNKHHISPGRRQVLLGIRGVCLVRGNEEFETLLAESLDSPPSLLDNGRERYGVPFLGDNSFMLEELSRIGLDDIPVEWLTVRDTEEPDEDDFSDPISRAAGPPFRLTLWADRAGMKTTRSAFFQTVAGRLDMPPESAWVTVGPLASVV